MGFCPNCGNWVDEGSICDCCGGSAGYSYEKEEDEEEIRNQERRSKLNNYSKKAWNFYMDFKEEDALHYINLALDLDGKNAENWNKKAIILEAMKRFEESLECYNKSLELSFNNLVCDNKVRMLYDWAAQLTEESKTSPDRLNKLEEAKEKIIIAINSIPCENSEENPNKYLRQKDTINNLINYERNLETLKLFDTEELFTITGMNFYKNAGLTSGMSLKLVKESDNEFDMDAIAVYAGDDIIGYVANKNNTKLEFTSSASQLQDKIQNVTQAKYLFYLRGYGGMQFHIGRIIK